MVTSDTNLREHLRDLPTGYLLELLADQESAHPLVIREILWERGLTPEEIDSLVQRRLHSRLPPIHQLWRVGRRITLLSTVLISSFNLFVFYQLLHNHHSLRGLLLTLSVGCIGFGFFIGYKLSTHLYQGGRHQLFCGFPLAVGSVNLETCKESILPKPTLVLMLAGNAVVGLAMTLFPLLLLYHLLT